MYVCEGVHTYTPADLFSDRYGGTPDSPHRLAYMGGETEKKSREGKQKRGEQFQKTRLCR